MGQIRCGNLKIFIMRYLALCFTLLLIECNKLPSLKDDILSIEQTNYLGNQLRIDGFYYQSLENNTYFTGYIFYNNGITLHIGSHPNSNLEEIENDLRSTDWFSVVREAKYMWGRFITDNTNIKFERWYPSEPPLKAYIREGTILNDTTFVITESYRMKDGNKTDITTGRNEIYHFRKFNPKPDSTNRFVP